nr:MFS transporter [Microlunatus panaciterrae]
MLVLVLLSAFEALAVTTAMPTISAELNGLRFYALAFAAPFATGVLAMVITGTWSDRSGPRLPLITTVAMFTAGLLIAGFADSMAVLVLGRVVQGFGGGMVVALYVVVARIYPGELHPKVFAAFAAAWVVPSLVGPLAAGLVTEHLGWRWVFLGVAALVVPAVVLLVPSLRDPRLGRPVDRVPGPWPLGQTAAGVVVGVAVLVLHLVTGDTLHWSPLLLVAAAVAALVMIGFAIRRLVPAGTLGFQPGLPSVVGMRGLVGATYISAEIYLPLLLVDHFGLSPSLAGLVLTTGALTWSTGSWLQSRLGDRAQDVILIRAGTAMIGTAVLIAMATAIWSLPAAVAIVGWAVAGGGMGLMYPRFSVLLLRYSTESQQGFNSSAGQIMEYTGMSVALAATGALFAVLIGFGGVLAYVAPFVLALLLAAAAFSRAGRVVPSSAGPEQVEGVPTGAAPVDARS